MIRFIAEHIRSSVRELEGSIIRLLAYASLRRREISVELAREALHDKLGALDTAAANGAATLSAATIQRTVAQEWGVTVDGLRSPSRTKQLTVPRQVAMFLIREMLGMQFGGDRERIRWA